MYCYYNVLPEAIFVVYWKTTLFTFFFSGDLPAMNICLHVKFQVRWCYGFGSTALQQDKRKKKTKNLKKHVSLYFPDVMSKYFYFW